ncbi:hypothetical protein [Flavobacterium sp.]|uniref:hypothetical protein n=1 Tax=Flavobacterium sp. TaxID=239 RepID=UPI0026111286|nr:hypothetical protein [Flavobacterium sp.]
MRHFFIHFLFLTLIVNNGSYTEWESQGQSRRYSVKIYDKKIEILIVTAKGESAFSYPFLDPKKKIFKMEEIKYCYNIVDERLYINYYEKKVRISVDEIITLVFKRKT